MNGLPIIGLNPEEQKARMDQLFLLMGAQVKSYHKQHHMGESTSVSVELAQELLESMLYTLDQAGSVAGNANISAGLERGQKILGEKLVPRAAAFSPGRSHSTGVAGRMPLGCRPDAGKLFTFL